MAAQIQLVFFFPYLAGLVGLVLGLFYFALAQRFLGRESLGDLKQPWISGGPETAAALAVALVSTLWALGLALAYGPTPAWLVYMVLGGVFIVASFIDWRTFILPDLLTYPAAVLALAGKIFLLGEPASGPLIGALCGPLLFWLLGSVYRRVRKVDGLGLGDVKLMASIGALVGWRGLAPAIFLASASALLASPFLPRARGDKSRAPIAFGPFLCLGAMLFVLFGQK